MSDLNNIPAEIHSSAHQVKYDNSLVGEYEVRIYRGAIGPVIVLEEGSSSPLPLEFISEMAVGRFQAQIPNSRARFFERHVVGAREAWVEVGFERGVFFRVPCQFEEVAAAFSESADNLRGHVDRSVAVARARR